MTTAKESTLTPEAERAMRRFMAKWLGGAVAIFGAGNLIAWISLTDTIRQKASDEGAEAAETAAIAAVEGDLALVKARIEQHQQTTSTYLEAQTSKLSERIAVAQQDSERLRLDQEKARGFVERLLLDIEADRVKLKKDIGRQREEIESKIAVDLKYVIDLIDDLNKLATGLKGEEAGRRLEQLRALADTLKSGSALDRLTKLEGDLEGMRNGRTAENDSLREAVSSLQSAISTLGEKTSSLRAEFGDAEERSVGTAALVADARRGLQKAENRLNALRPTKVQVGVERLPLSKNNEKKESQLQVVFDKPFDSTPSVHIALTSLDDFVGGNIFVDSSLITPQGFVLHAQKAGGRLDAVKVSWMAISAR